jgi:hypothetical protein
MYSRWEPWSRFMYIVICSSLGYAEIDSISMLFSSSCERWFKTISFVLNVGYEHLHLNYLWCWRKLRSGNISAEVFRLINRWVCRDTCQGPLIRMSLYVEVEPNWFLIQCFHVLGSGFKLFPFSSPPFHAPCSLWCLKCGANRSRGSIIFQQTI